MKRLKYILILLLAVNSAGLHADIIMIENPKAMIYSRITNLNDFPDVVVVGVTDCVTLNTRKASRINHNQFIEVQKPCTVSLYVMKSDYFNNNKLDKIDWDNDKNVQKLNLSLSERDFNSNTFISATVDFNLANHQDSVYYLYRTEMAYKYKIDSRRTKPDSVLHFKDDVNPFTPITVKIEDGTPPYQFIVNIKGVSDSR
jgi:hypothetical protein